MTPVMTPLGSVGIIHGPLGVTPYRASETPVGDSLILESPETGLLYSFAAGDMQWESYLFAAINAGGIL